MGLLSGRIAETIEVGDGIYNDLVNYGEIIGAEILNYSWYQTRDGDALDIFERLPSPRY